MTPERWVLEALIRKGLAVIVPQSVADTWRLGTHVRSPTAPILFRIDWAKMELDAAEQAVAVVQRRRVG